MGLKISRQDAKTQRFEADVNHLTSCS